jgi:hypothetical protein
MTNYPPANTPHLSVADAARACVDAYLQKVFSGKVSLLCELDRWTQALIENDNMAKLELVFEADDPAEACYRDLIREIDTEAQSGIYLARRGTGFRHLARVVDESGVSGSLYQEIDVVSPAVFPDEHSHSADNLDLVWVTIEARHDRAHVDAAVSEIIMRHLLGDAEAAGDMVNVLRAFHYAHNEDLVRRQCGMQRILDARDANDLAIMVREHRARSGSYEARVDEIRHRADQRLRRPPA